MQESFVSEPLPEASLTSQKYVVGKNDTLQKISKKFYGTTKKWTKIYEANKDVLKGPDKVYPGQTLNIPDAAETKPTAETLSEPKENLK
jgi:nucleoid-associated protein YgaU